MIGLKNNIIRKIYREEDLERTQMKIDMLGKKVKFDATTFINFRLLSSLIVFIVIMYSSKHAYLFAPAITLVWYYAYHYFLLTKPIKERIRKLDHEALYFFEILTLTLESGRNLENSLEVTTSNVHSELSDEFKRSLLEVHFGKSLLEALEDMKKRIPSETINNIILNITQTNIFGNSILDTMYNQIAFLRDKQILEIKGQINKIPNKISIVSVLFVVPLILILILGPFVLNFLG